MKYIHFAQLSLFFITSLMSSTLTHGQDYFSEGRKRLNFAQTYVGADFQYYPAFSSYKNTGQDGKSYHNPSILVPNLQMGGIHFWGHADFYISIPLGQLTRNQHDGYLLNESVVTGARYLPWAYQYGKIRPFLGIASIVRGFKLAHNGNLEPPLFNTNKLRFDGGLIFEKYGVLGRIGLSAIVNNKMNYPISPSVFAKLKFPTYSPFVGINYTFETTRSKNMEDINNKLNEIPPFTSAGEASSPSSGWFIGVGASSSWLLNHSSRNERLYPFLNPKGVSNTFADMAAGYHFSRVGIVSAFSYRGMKYVYAGYGISQKLTRRSILWENYKFIFDYNGFTPYVGFGLGKDSYVLNETSNGISTRWNHSRWSECLVMGWDILPGKTKQRWVLRTNLRWFPFEHIDVDGEKIRLSQLEYNVIQLVWYPGR